MAFWSSLFKHEQPIEVFTPNVTYVADASGLVEALNIGGMSPSRLWACQPHLRTVVSFVARNIAQLGLHVFERVDETDRRRDRTSLAARTIAGVDGLMTTYDLVFALVGDLLLYDRAYWWVAESTSTTSGWMIRRLPPSWVSENRSNPFEVDSYRVVLGNQSQTIPANKILPFTSYSPAKTSWGSSTVESLKQTLQEQIEAARYRSQVWEKGGRVSAVLERPKDAPQWTDAQAERFREDWYAKYTGRGSQAGGTPILEDGMKLSRIDFNAQEQQFVEAAKLSLSTVAAAFHVNPTMVGVLDNANFSNVEAFRKMLYADSLGPYITQIEQRINTFLLSMLDMDPARFYVEFNIAEKLQGSFQEQTTALQSATGAPWMTRAEARARMNLPAIPDSDGLVIPLNVIVGGQASPNDSGSQNRRSREISVKARGGEFDRRASDLLASFFDRQEKAVRTALGLKAADWWDEDRWNSELAADLYRLAVAVADRLGKDAAAALGFDDSDYDTDRTRAFLKKVAENRAVDINAATRIQIEAALASDDRESAVDSVWNVAKGSRSVAAAAAMVTFFSGFGQGEAAKQLAGDHAVKTWVVTSSNPRPSHAAMSGETVPTGERFSNSMRWPGDSSNADEVAGCTCEIVISREGI